VALIATSGGGARRTRRSRAPAAPASERFPHTQAGAVAAATAWCQNTGRAFFNGTLDSAVSALATASFRVRAEREVGAASAFVHRRLRRDHAYAFRVWPLGYAVQQYSPTAARVHVWQLMVLEIVTPREAAAYGSTTVSLQWVTGTWKVAESTPGPDLTPPGGAATATQVSSWINSTNQLTDYQYAP
jgi:hypothetical protein